MAGMARWGLADKSRAAGRSLLALASLRELSVSGAQLREVPDSMVELAEQQGLAVRENILLGRLDLAAGGGE